MEERKVKIYSYTKVWKIEKKIYAISNIVLPAPVNPYDLLYYVGVAAVVFVLGNIIPAITVVPTVIRFVILPYLITTYLMKKKLDGKNPVMYLFGCIRYAVIVKGNYIQTFKTHPDKKQIIKLNWKCSMGTRE